MSSLIRENPLKDLSESNEISIQKILINLLDGKKNLDLKTQIDKPKELASLVSLANYLKQHKYPISYNTIMKFITTYLRYMVSYNRMSRKEIIKALTPVESKIKDYMDNKFSTKID